MEKIHILLADDEQSQREPIAGFLTKKGYKVFQAQDVNTAVQLVKNNSVDIIISDYNMPGKTGLNLLNETKAINPFIPIIIVTAYGSIETAVEIMKSGAYDYIQKPIDLQELLLTIDKAVKHNLLISENLRLKKELFEKHNFDKIISASEEMEKAVNTAIRVAKSKASVIIRGESGTGKELIARAIHFSSDRANKPFVVVNCAALPETLFESELFGNEKGAYTGADRQRIGKFEQADGGTLFIDEVGDIPLQVQVKLLRAVQFGEVQRLGGKSSITVDVRIITATNRNLEEMISSGDFREDLFYRFNVIEIPLAPLRNRKADIPILVEHFIKYYSDINGKQVKSISREALDALMKYNFPGNVRELENIIHRAVVFARQEIVTSDDLPEFISNQESFKNNSIINSIEITDLNLAVDNLERSLISKALNASNGNQVKAAELLNISERTLRYKIQKLNLK